MCTLMVHTTARVRMVVASLDDETPVWSSSGVTGKTGPDDHGFRRACKLSYSGP